MKRGIVMKLVPNDCMRCRCNSCVFLNVCPYIPEADMKAKKSPCSTCKQGERYKPTEKAPCPSYKRAE